VNPFKLVKSMFTPAPRLSAAECFERVRSGAAVLVDVREPGEWADGVAERALLLPLTDLTAARTQWKPFLDQHDGREILLYCAAGGRSAIAARALAAEGFRTANAGSLAEWAAAGWPIVKPARRRN
jgi:rhodanese-related sulfurtransferase